MPTKKPKKSGSRVGEVSLRQYVERVADDVWHGRFVDACYTLKSLPKMLAVLVSLHVAALTRESPYFENFLRVAEEFAFSGG